LPWLLRIEYNLQQRRDVLTEFHTTLVQALFFGYAAFGVLLFRISRKIKIISSILGQISFAPVEISLTTANCFFQFLSFSTAEVRVHRGEADETFSFQTNSFVGGLARLRKFGLALRVLCG
jgi:hypothetical protein